MKNYFKSILLFFKRFLLVLFIYQICRFLFLYFNKSAFSGLDLKVFLGGIHFDLSAIAYINILFVFLHLFPAKFIYKKGYQRALKIAFYTVNLIFILTNFVDFEYYKFTGRRSTFSMITASGMENEIGRLMLSFLKEFWYLPLLGIVLAIAFWKVIPTLSSSIVKEN